MTQDNLSFSARMELRGMLGLESLDENLEFGDVAGFLRDGVIAISDDLIGWGNDCMANLLKEPLEEAVETDALFFHFEVAEQGKNLLLLWRDVFFEHVKAGALLAENEISLESGLDHWGKSVRVLRDATSDTLDLLEMGYAGLQNTSVRKKNLELWNIQNNPWPVYQEQIKALKEQCYFLFKQNAELLGLQISFRELERSIRGSLETSIRALQTIQKISEGTLSSLAEEKISSMGAIFRLLDSADQERFPEELGNKFSTELKPLLEALPGRWKASVASRGGIMLTEDMNLLARVKEWLENQIFPILYEVWELTEAAVQSFRVSISNIRNRLQLLPPGTRMDQINLQDYTLPLQHSLENVKRVQAEVLNYGDTIQTNLQKEFRLSILFNPQRAFLPLPGQLSVRRLGEQPARVWKGAFDWVGLRIKWIENLRQKIREEERLGASEKVARFIENRKPDPANHNYTSIFLTKGFVGTSFASGRIAEMERIRQVVHLWHQQYRGAVLLTGPRLCGKTFFGEWVLSRFFPEQVLRIQPGVETVWRGRKLAPTWNLKEVLDFVKKYALRSQPALWLDDLELWHHPQFTLFENMEALVHFNDHHAKRCFVLASINPWALKKIEHSLSFQAAFQAVVPLDQMPVADIGKAILIRHGATHKKLISKTTGDLLAAEEFQKVLTQMVRASHGNVGEAINWWLSSVRTANESEVFIQFSDKYSFPASKDEDVQLLLSEILWQKKTSEYLLRRYFGPAFNDRFVHVLRRLQGLGLLHRLPDESLEIHELAVNAVGGSMDLKNKK